MSDQIRWLTGRLLLFVFAVAGSTVAIGIVRWSIGEISQWQYGRQPASAVFLYESVEYAGTDEAGDLLFISTAAFYETVDRVDWLDQLRCRNTDGERFGVYSSAADEANSIGPTDMGPSPAWRYQGDTPDDGRECRLRSSILVENRGVLFRQIVDSTPFRTPTEVTE